ncbi:MAG: enoyl-CoA hydratase/isomerase family protein [Saprospiraceae bacterium]
MEYQNLAIKNEDNILVVTLNRPKALNALNKQTMDELAYFFGEDEAPKQLAIKGIVVTGAGEKAFVAGADIKEFLGMDAEAGSRLSRRGNDIMFMIERFPKPVIAAVNGFALGGGCELAMACHIRIAGEKARFGQPEVNLGIIPGYGGTQRLIQHVGKGKAMELAMTGDMIGAEEAKALGLANHVVPVGEEVNKAKEIINKIAKKAPIAIAKVIECTNAYFTDCVNGFETEINSFGALTGSEDFVEGASAFVEKRRAAFKGK